MALSLFWGIWLTTIWICACLSIFSLQKDWNSCYVNFHSFQKKMFVNNYRHSMTPMAQLWFCFLRVIFRGSSRFPLGLNWEFWLLREACCFLHGLLCKAERAGNCWLFLWGRYLFFQSFLACLLTSQEGFFQFWPLSTIPKLPPLHIISNFRSLKT